MTKYDQKTEFQQLQSENERLNKNLAAVETRLIRALIASDKNTQSVGTRVTLLTVAVIILTLTVVIK